MIDPNNNTSKSETLEPPGSNTLTPQEQLDLSQGEVRWELDRLEEAMNAASNEGDRQRRHGARDALLWALYPDRVSPPSLLSGGSDDREHAIVSGSIPQPESADVRTGSKDTPKWAPPPFDRTLVEEQIVRLDAGVEMAVNERSRERFQAALGALLWVTAQQNVQSPFEQNKTADDLDRAIASGSIPRLSGVASMIGASADPDDGLGPTLPTPPPAPADERRRFENVLLGAVLAASAVNAEYRTLLGEKPQTTPLSSFRMGALNVLANLDWTPEKSHEVWLAFKRMNGWTYGPEQDAAKKTHPCMVAYADLPAEQKFKDLLFISTVRATVQLRGVSLTDAAPLARAVLEHEDLKAGERDDG